MSNMINKIQLPPLPIDFDFENGIAKMTHKIAVEYEKKVDEIILKSIYETYKGMANEVIVIDETEFKEFIYKYLPIYLKDKEKVS